MIKCKVREKLAWWAEKNKKIRPLSIQLSGRTLFSTLFWGQLFCCIDPVDKCYDRDGSNGENEEQDFLRLVFYFDAAERPLFCHLRLIDMVMVVMMVMMSRYC